MDTIPLRVLIIFALILFGFLINMARSAIVTVTDSAVEKRAEGGDKKAQKLFELIKKPTAFTQSASNATFAVFFGTAYFVYRLIAPFVSLFLMKTVTSWTAYGIFYYPLMAVITLAICLLLVVLIKTVPSKIGSAKAETLAYSLCSLMVFVKVVMTPFNAVAGWITNGLVRLFGADPHFDEEKVTEEEIMMMVDAGEEKGVIEEAQRLMINNIFEFDDTDISEIMTHRIDIEAVEIDRPLADVVPLAIEHGYSRIPVYEGDLDNIKGILYVKDLMKFIGADLGDTSLAEIMRSVYYVPDSKKCADLFGEMTEKHIQMCVVVDEYGGTAGIITIEDLLEAIVGNMQDEYDDEEEEIAVINETTFTFDGATSVDDVAEQLGVELPEGEYDTLGGLIISEIGKIPEEDEEIQIEINSVSFKVLSVSDRRIDKVLVEKPPKE